MAPRRPTKGGHATGARPQNTDMVAPDEVETDADAEAAAEDEQTAGTSEAIAEPKAVAKRRKNVLEEGRDAKVTATDLQPPKVERGRKIAKRDMYDHGGPRGGLRLVARKGQAIPAWYRG